MTLPLILALLYLVIGWYLSLFIRGTDRKDWKNSVVGNLTYLFSDFGLLEAFFAALWPIWAAVYWWPWSRKK